MNIAFFASHGGSNFQAIVEALRNQGIAANPVLLISNNSDAYALERAKNLGVEPVHISSAQYDTGEEFQAALLNLLDKHNIDLVVLAGYMRMIPKVMIEKYRNRILNIHPALLPKYGGKGMYGMNVHRAVHETGEKESGATVHLVNEKYDEGRILKQEKVAIEPTDSPEDIAKKVLEVEHRIYAQTIKEIVEGSLELD
ncbi:MAG: phosphoribosylglycinamide formyltransferase [Chlorobiota bacterium]